MKLFIFIASAMFSANVFALYPVGHFKGGCVQTSGMQEYKDGKKVGKAFETPGYNNEDLVVTKDGSDEILTYKTKIFFKDGPKEGTEFDFSQKLQKISDNVERRTDLKEGSYSDYRVEDDGTMTWIGSVYKNGKTLKPPGITNDYITPDGNTIVGVQFDDVGAEGNLQPTFSGWAYAGGRMWCQLSRVK